MEAVVMSLLIRDKDGATMKTEVMNYNQVRNEVSSDQSFVWMSLAVRRRCRIHIRPGIQEDHTREGRRRCGTGGHSSCQTK